jgi:galactokinase
MRESEAQQKASLFEAAQQQLVSSNSDEILRWFVPGRIEVLGKHTDYAGGRSLLCTAERGFCVAALPRSDTLVRVHDVVRQASYEFNLSHDLAVPASSWRVYVSVVARRVARNFPGTLRGADISLASDLPSAAGMSSSSALVVAIFAALSAVNHLPDRTEYRESIQSDFDVASYLGCVENGQSCRELQGDRGVGTFGGSEDHTAILTSEPGHLKQYSFCPLRHENTVKLLDDCIFVIAVSGVAASKTGSANAAYNRASLSAREILERWHAQSGSKALTLADAASSSPDAPDQIRAMLETSNTCDSHALLNRFEQFWLESETIIPQASDALACGDLATFGRLVDQSQSASETLLGNQVPETVWLARAARELGAHAASAFGAGFGGSVWALVSRPQAVEFARLWQESYRQSGHGAAANSLFFVTAAGPPMLRL